ncbi:hypothetical protein V6N13_048418 [Hibiscus sabdariffa]
MIPPENFNQGNILIPKFFYFTIKNHYMFFFVRQIRIQFNLFRLKNMGWIRSISSKHRYMKDIMDLIELGKQCESISHRTNFLQNFEWTDIPRAKLPFLAKPEDFLLD